MHFGQLRWLPALTLVLVGCGASSAGRVVQLAAETPASAWPQASGSAARSSPATARGPQDGHVRWSRTLEGAVVPGPVVGIDASILAASNAGVLHALDPVTGKDRWTYDGGGPYGSDLSTSPAVLSDGTVLWPGPGNALHALSRDGKLLWKEQLAGFVLSPAAVGSRVYVADQAGTLEALEVTATSHRVAWKTDTGSGSHSSPSVGPGGRVYVAHDRTVTAVVDLGDRPSTAWTFTTKDTIEVSTAVAPDGTVIVGTNGDVEYALTPAGKVRWRFDKGDWSYSSPVVALGRAWFGDHLGFLDEVDLATGRAVHRDLGIAKAAGRTADGTGVWTAPVVDRDGNVYFGTAAGHVYGFAADGRRLWDADRGQVVASYPALTGDGTLVVGDTGGTLTAYGK